MRKLLRALGIGAVALAIPVGSAVVTATPSVATTIFRPPVNIWHNSVKSTNWSGYAVAATSKFTDVVGSWKQPIATCSGSGDKYAAFWVGIDGYTSQTVEQLGTDSDCNGSSPSYYGWYEMYPAGSVNLSSKYRVSPGDKITAEVKVSGSSFTLSMKDVTAGWTFSTTKTGSSSLKQSSAEWIAEAPSSISGVLPLSDFGKVTFSNAEAATGGSDEPISSFTDSSGPHRITMTNTAKTATRAAPGKVFKSGKGFEVTWKSS